MIHALWLLHHILPDTIFFPLCAHLSVIFSFPHHLQSDSSQDLRTQSIRELDRLSCYKFSNSNCYIYNKIANIVNNVNAVCHSFLAFKIICIRDIDTMKTFLLNDCVGIFTLGKVPFVVWKSGTRASRCSELLDIGAGNQNLVSWEISKNSEQQSLFSSPIFTCQKTLINIQTVELPWNIIKNFEG